MANEQPSASRYCGVSIVGPGVDTQCRVESEDDLQIVVAQIRKALGVRSERGTSYDAATAWLIERSDGSRELVFSPLTDDVPMDEGDEARPLYERPD